MAEPEADKECRICRGEDEPERPLLHPCRCSGSIKYTHEDCLVNWLAQSGSSRCELCNHSFRFEPQYQPNTPSALPTKEFISGILALMRKTLKTAARIVLVFTVWLFFLPVGTCWTWYALFINSPSQLPALLATRGPSGVVTDAFYGFLLSAGIVFIFLGVSSLREYVRHFPHDLNPENDQAPFEIFMNDDDVVPDDFDDYETDDNRNLQQNFHAAQAEPADNQAAEPHPNQEFREGIPAPADGEPQRLGGPDAVHADADEEMNDVVFDEFDELVRDTFDIIAGEDSDEDENRNEEGMADNINNDEQELFNVHPDGREQHPLLDFQAPDSEDEYAASASDLMEDDEYQRPALMEGDLHVEELQDADPPNDAENHHVDEDEPDARGEGGAIFGLFELDPDEVPLEEVVGLRGHIRNLFDNAGTVLVSNAIFLGVFTLIPLLIGRLTLRLFSMHSFPVHIISGDSSVYARLRDFTKAWDGLNSPAVENVSRAVSVATADSRATAESLSRGFNVYGDQLSPLPDALAATAVLESQTKSAVVAAATHDQPLVSYVDNFLIVLLGYGMIALIAVAYIGIMSMLRQRYPRLDSPITRQIARMLRYVATFVKIVVLILFEFGVFPLGCGWWLDICTLELFGGSLQSRLSYCQESPWTCTAGHWIMGIIYMVHISLFISLLREVVKPELLWFLRNPDDPEFHPFRELVEKPLSRHARRMCISVIIYVPLILALVHVPGQLCLKLLPHVFPFRSEDFSHILIDLPFGNLLIGPLIRLLYFGRPEVSLHKLVAFWIRWVSTALGIQHLVVKEEDNEGQNLGPQLPHGVAGLPPGDQGPLNRMFANPHDLPVDHINLADGHDEARDAEEELDEDEGDESQVAFIRARAGIMILLAWLTLIAAESALLALPTVVGRFLMSAVGLPVRHDLHPFLLGLNVLLGFSSGVFKVVKYFQTADTFMVLSLGLPYLYLGGKGIVIVTVWLGVIPLAAGLLFELILVPIRVSFNETPYFCLHQDWALGLLLLKVWSCIAVTGGLGAKWRERVLRAREGDIIGLDQNFGRTMREVVIPVLVSVVTALSVPYSVARGLLPLLGVSRWISNLFYRYAYLVITCLYCGFEGLRYSVSILRDLHDSIRDDKYLVGKRLHNFIEVQDEPVTSQ